MCFALQRFQGTTLLRRNFSFSLDQPGSHIRGGGRTLGLFFLFSILLHLVLRCLPPFFYRERGSAVASLVDTDVEFGIRGENRQRGHSSRIFFLKCMVCTRQVNAALPPTAAQQLSSEIKTTEAKTAEQHHPISTGAEAHASHPCCRLDTSFSRAWYCCAAVVTGKRMSCCAASCCEAAP